MDRGQFPACCQGMGAVRRGAGGIASQTVSTCQVARERTSLCGRRSSADCPGLPYPAWKGGTAVPRFGPAWLDTLWSANIADRAGEAGPRLLCTQRRIYLGDRPGEPGSHGQNRRPPKSDLSISSRPNKLLGTHPLNWFSSRRRFSNLERWPSSGGISPLNWFSRKSKTRRLERLPISGGISPVNWLLERRKTRRLERRPTSGGISPLNWSLERRNNRRLERRPTSGGISPLTWPLENKRSEMMCSPVTLPLELIVTPRHLPTGTSLDQVRSPRAFWMAIRASISVSSRWDGTSN